MKREKRLTKRERKALAPQRPAPAHNHHHQHIHCVACGRHIEPEEFDSSHALWLTCNHGSQFPACVECKDKGVALLAEHDRSGNPVRTANAWH